MFKTYLLALTVLLCTVQARAENPWQDIPHIVGAWEKSDRQKLNAECKLIQEKPRIVDCQFTSVMIIKPSKEDINKELAEIEQSFLLPKTIKEVNEFCANIKNNSDEQLKSACANGPTGVAEYFKWQTVNIGAITCEVTIYNFSALFKQLNENTWIHSDTSAGLCNYNMTIHLWRQPGDKSLWNYKQMRVLPPNGENTKVFGMGCTNNTQDFQWRHKSTATECKYFK